MQKAASKKGTMMAESQRVSLSTWSLPTCTPESASSFFIPFPRVNEYIYREPGLLQVYMLFYLKYRVEGPAKTSVRLSISRRSKKEDCSFVAFPQFIRYSYRSF